MTPDQLAAWLARHGALDHEATSMTGQRIIFAKDGSRVVLTELTPDTFRVDDNFEKDAPTGGGTAAAPDGAPATPPAADAAPPAATGNTISQEQLAALVEQAAPGRDPNRWQFNRGTRTRQIQQFGLPSTVQVPYVTWIDPGTGRTLDYEVNPGGGSYVEVFNGIKDENKATAAQIAAGQSSTEPPKVDDRGGRHYVWKPNPPGSGGGGEWVDSGPAPLTAAEQAAAGGSNTEPLEGYPGWNVAVIKEGPSTRKVYINPQGQQAQDPRPAAAPPEGEIREDLNVNGQRVIKVTTKNTATNRAETYYTDAEGRRVPPPADRADQVKAEVAPDGSYGYWDRSGPSPKWVAIPPSDAPGIQRKPEYVKGAGYGVWVPGEGGIPRFQPVLTVTPTDIPVLQAKFGEVAQGLGQLAAELNGRVARGEMTEEQKNEAFAQAHQQASTLVEETNTLLGTSKAIWAQEIAQRGQTFTEAANRRSFAGNVLDNALGQGAQMARGALPSGAKAIAGAVGAMLSIGQQYAQGMGGFPDMAEVRMPRALEQARDIGLPGMGGPPGVPPVVGAAPQLSTASTSPGGPNAIGVGGIGNVPPPGAPAPGVSDTMDAGGVPRVRTPAAATSAPPSPGPPPPVAPAPLPPPPAAGGPPPATLPQAPPRRDDWRLTPGAPPETQRNVAVPGEPLGLAGLGAGLNSGMAGSPMGMPAAMGGGGYFDPAAEMQSMMAASTSPTSFGGAGVADPDWEDAVRRAYADASKYGGF